MGAEEGSLYTSVSQESLQPESELEQQHDKKQAGGSIYASKKKDGRRLTGCARWRTCGWLLASAASLAGIYAGTWLAMWSILFYRERWENYRDSLSFWFCWSRPGLFFFPWALQQDVGEEQRLQKDLSCWILAVILLAASLGLLWLSASKLAVWRDDTIGRRLQRPLHACGGCLRHRWLNVTLGEILLDSTLLGICCYWLTPKLFCRGGVCSRWPPPFGTYPLRRYAHHMGTVSGLAMVVALLPLPKRPYLSPTMALLGISFEKGVRIHRVMGRAAVVFGVLHTVLIVYDWEKFQSTRPSVMELTIDEIKPWCTQPPVPPWPWNTAGGWVDGVEVGVAALNGWGGPPSVADTGARPLVGQDLELSKVQCPWLFDTSHEEYHYTCFGSEEGGGGDAYVGAVAPPPRVVCRGASCCVKYGGRALCPPTSPNMCATPDACAGGTDFCCESSDCTQSGGLRPCYLNVTALGPTASANDVAENAAAASGDGGVLRLNPPSARTRLAKTNGCIDKRYFLWHIGFTGERNKIYNFCGLVAVTMFVLLALGGCSCVRRNYFELFYKSHLVTALVGFTALCFHYHMGKMDTVAPLLALMLVDYIWRLWLVRSGDTTVEAIEVIRLGAAAAAGGNNGGGDVVKLTLRHPTSRITEPGQYCFLRIGQLAQYQWHPFSVVTSPAECESSGGRFVIYIRDFGSWTRGLVELGPTLFATPGPAAAAAAQQLAPAGGGCCGRGKRWQKQRQQIGCDGFYGKVTVPLERYRTVVLVCGGIGATPMLSVLSHLMNKQNKQNKLRQQSQRRVHVCFVWCLREMELLRCFESTLLEAAALGWDLRIHLTAGESARRIEARVGAGYDEIDEQEDAERAGLIPAQDGGGGSERIAAEEGDGLAQYMQQGRPDLQVSHGLQLQPLWRILTAAVS